MTHDNGQRPQFKKHQQKRLGPTHHDHNPTHSVLTIYRYIRLTASLLFHIPVGGTRDTTRPLCRRVSFVYAERRSVPYYAAERRRAAAQPRPGSWAGPGAAPSAEPSRDVTDRPTAQGGRPGTGWPTAGQRTPSRQRPGVGRGRRRQAARTVAPR